MVPGARLYPLVPPLPVLESVTAGPPPFRGRRTIATAGDDRPTPPEPSVPRRIDKSTRGRAGRAHKTCPAPPWPASKPGSDPDFRAKRHSIDPTLLRRKCPFGRCCRIVTEDAATGTRRLVRSGYVPRRARSRVDTTAEVPNRLNRPGLKRTGLGDPRAEVSDRLYGWSSAVVSSSPRSRGTVTLSRAASAWRARE